MKVVNCVGGVLSPLLANVLLDEVDKELEKRGHSFARYADDCNVYVRSRRAGERVMETLRRLYARLRLRVNEAKSAVARPWDRKFLGYGFWVAKGKVVKRRVAAKALATMKVRVRELTNRNRGAKLTTIIADLAAYLRGWKEYFQLADTPKVFDKLDEWTRRRLRMVQLKQWKRGTTAYRAFRARGVGNDAARMAAAHVRRWWHVATWPAANTAMPPSFFDQKGLPRLGR